MNLPPEDVPYLVAIAAIYLGSITWGVIWWVRRRAQRRADKARWAAFVESERAWQEEQERHRAEKERESEALMLEIPDRILARQREQAEIASRKRKVQVGPDWRRVHRPDGGRGRTL